MHTKDLQYKITIKDIILITFFTILVVTQIITYIRVNGYSDASELIKQIIIVMLAIVGVFDTAAYKHFNFLVPDFLIYFQEKKRKDEIALYMEEYFKHDIKFIRDYNEEHIKFILSQMQITTSQLDKIRMDLIKMRCLPLKTLGDAERKIEYYVKSDYPLVITENDVHGSELSYHAVKYYINFTDSMFLKEYAKEVSAILSLLIEEKADLSKIDRLIIPHDSNFLLGVEVGKRLGKPIVKMRYKEGKIITDQPWEGQLNSNDKVIIIHDVLVKADQVEHALKMLPATCDVLGVYCLISRKEYDGVERLQERNIAVNQVLSLDDKDIEEMRKRK